MKSTKSLERRLKLAEKSVANWELYVKQINKEYTELLKKDSLKRKIYDLNYRINSLRRQKGSLEVELKKLFEV